MPDEKMIPIGLRLGEKLHAQVEKARGDVPRELWIRRQIEARLREAEQIEGDRRTQHHGREGRE